MAEEDTYINEAYEVLQKLSADERKRLEYEARQKSILDYNSRMSSSMEEGIKIGEARGEKHLLQLNELLLNVNRIDDLKKTTAVASFRTVLYK